MTVTGMVLMAAPAGDYDKRLVVLTRERGKITVFARGARKSTSPFLAAANPFVFGSFQVYQGKTAYTLAQANIKEYFTELAARQPGVYYGFYFLEIAEYFGQEGSEETDMLNLLYVTMKALLHDGIPDSLIRSVFELKALVINGEYPRMFECCVDGRRERLTHYSRRYSGVICETCALAVPDARPLSAAALYTIQYIIASPLDKLYRFTLKPEVQKEVEAFSERYIDEHTDRKFKSLEVLKVMA